MNRTSLFSKGRPPKRPWQDCWHGVLAFLIVSVGMLGCGERATAVAADDRNLGAGPPSQNHHAVVNEVAYASSSPSERAQAEQEAIARILQRVPAEWRDSMQAILEDPRLHPSVSSDPAIAADLGIILSIRAASVAPELARAEAVRAEELRSRLARIRVTVALVPELPVGDARAVVLRRPGDQGTPLVLLRSGGHTGVDLAAGLRASALLVKRYGPAVQEPIRVVLRNAQRSGASGTAELGSTDWSPYLSLLATSAARDIEGVGVVRAMDMLAPRVP